MIRLVATAIISLLANAVALVVGALVLDDMALEPVGFAIALVIFTVTGVLIEPLLRQIALKNVPALLGSSALIGTLVSLVVTAVVSDGLTIRGGSTWVLATIVVWLVALVARLLLPLVIFKKALGRVSDPSR